MIDSKYIINKPSEANFIGIYVIYNKINGKYYIGSSVNIANRVRDHLHRLNNNKHYNNHLQKSWNKYGSNNFLFCLPIKTINLEEARKLEEYLIDFFDSYDRDIGYNICRFTSTGNLSEETKEKIKLARIGKKASIETRKKMSKSRKGRKLSKKHVEKLRTINTGIKFSKERRKKISEAALRHRGISKDICENIIKMYTDGEKIQNIRAVTGKNSKTIYNILRKNNISIGKR